ncbi:MAG: FAD-dependent oxidoreductase, partial [Solirubrobacterales bacterium]
ESGAELPYEDLVIATGSRPVMLADAEGLENVQALRTVDDALRLRDALQPGSRLGVVGAGLISQEVASTASKRDVNVTLIEAEPLPLARALHPDLALWLVEMQRSAGIDVRLDTAVTKIVAEEDRAVALELSDGSRVEVDHVLVAIGIRPADEWLPEGLEKLLERPEIHAAGDVAGGEHWEAAGRQGRAAAQKILGNPPAEEALSSWWTDIHGVRIPGFGNSNDADELQIDGDMDEPSFTVVALRDVTLQGEDGRCDVDAVPVGGTAGGVDCGYKAHSVLLLDRLAALQLAREPGNRPEMEGKALVKAAAQAPERSSRSLGTSRGQATARAPTGVPSRRWLRSPKRTAT